MHMKGENEQALNVLQQGSSPSKHTTLQTIYNHKTCIRHVRSAWATTVPQSFVSGVTTTSHSVIETV
jgi:hypothetical protein